MEIWEVLGLISHWKLEVAVLGVKVSFYKLKFSVYRTGKTLVKANFSYYTELTENEWNLACHQAADIAFIFAF